MELNDLLQIQQYSLNQQEKDKLLLPFFQDLHSHHFENCYPYQRISEALFQTKNSINSIEEMPFVPVGMYKSHDLFSIPESDVFKIIRSSGTTGAATSKVYLDKETASLQSLALSKILGHILGNQRLPMIIVDSKSVLTDRSSFSARGAGILGLSLFGKNHTYILDADYQFDPTAFTDFIEKYSGQPMLIFGFTFMVWQFLVETCQIKADLSQATLIHSGGWKKLIEQAVDNDTFKKTLKEKYGLNRVFNFYGMVEQVGGVFLENSLGYLHCPNFTDVIIRNPKDLSVQPIGEEGLIQVISVLPKSYPGHSILTEDIGVLEGIDDCPNNWKGKYFKIIGRAKKAELRGCSDTFAASQTNNK